MDTEFEMAQTLRRAHCDRQGEDHECVGELTVKRGTERPSGLLCVLREGRKGDANPTSDTGGEMTRGTNLAE